MTLLRLKLELLQYGFEPSDGALLALPQSKFGEVTHKDYPTTGGLIVVLPGEIYANAPIRYDRVGDKKYYLDYEGGFRLKGEGLNLKVQVLPSAHFALHNTRLETGEPVRDMVAAHGHRVRISPLAGCAYSCRFCNMPSVLYRLYEREKLDAAFQTALNDPGTTPEHVLISGGAPRPEKGDYRSINAIYEYFPGTYRSLKFDVMLAPRTLNPDQPTKRRYRHFLGFLKDAGIDALSVNIELFNDEIRRQTAPEKGKIGIDNYLLFLEQAAEIFGGKKVRSVLIVGIEPMEDTLRGVEAIAERGCLPELSPFIPDPAAAMARHERPSVDFLEKLLVEVTRRAQDAGWDIGPFCRACSHNICDLPYFEPDIPLDRIA